MDLWWLALGALLLMIGAVFSAVQELEELEKRNKLKAQKELEEVRKLEACQNLEALEELKSTDGFGEPGSLGLWAAWKHRLTLFGTGLVAIGASGSVVLKPEFSIQWAIAAIIALGVSLGVAFVAVTVTLGIRRGFHKSVRRTLWTTAFAVVVWGSPTASNPAKPDWARHEVASNNGTS